MTKFTSKTHCASHRYNATLWCYWQWILPEAGQHAYRPSTFKRTFTYQGEKMTTGWMRTGKFGARGQGFEVASKARISGNCCGSGGLSMLVVDLAK